jgi:hypothetical protein
MSPDPNKSGAERAGTLQCWVMRLSSATGFDTIVVSAAGRIRFLPDAQAEKIESVDRVVMETRSRFLVVEHIQVAGDGVRWFLSTKALRYGPDGTLSGLIGIARNMDERKRAEDEVRTANQQKDLLLYDISDRVKNHLRSVMATLSLSCRG